MTADGQRPEQDDSGNGPIRPVATESYGGAGDGRRLP